MPPKNSESAPERPLLATMRRFLPYLWPSHAPGLRARGIDTPPRGRTTVEMLDRLGVLRARPLLIHCVLLDGDEIRPVRPEDPAAYWSARSRMGWG
mgnify:CR=1 FL=1